MATRGDLYKVVLIGDSGVGKSNLHSRFSQNKINTDATPRTIMQFDTNIMEIEGKTIKAQIWDTQTARKEQYDALKMHFYAGTDGALLIFDMTKRWTYEKVHWWLQELRAHVGPDIAIGLVGNKSDLIDMRSVSAEALAEKAKAFARRNRLQFIETSAFDSTNVETAFRNLLAEIYRKRNTTTE